jgi:hypothetical protein
LGLDVKKMLYIYIYIHIFVLVVGVGDYWELLPTSFHAAQPVIGKVPTVSKILGTGFTITSRQTTTGKVCLGGGTRRENRQMMAEYMVCYAKPESGANRVLI